MSRGTGRRSLPIFAVAAAVVALALIAPAGAAARINYGSRAMKLGARGHDVWVLQRFLTRLRVPTKRDGVYGRGTRHNVKRLEARRRWRRDGNVDRRQARRIRRLVVVANKKRRRQTSVGPQKRYYFFGLAVPTITLTGQSAGTVDVEVRDADDEVTMKLNAELVEGGGSSGGSGGTGGGVSVPGEEPPAEGFEATLRWYGRNLDKRPAPDGSYSFAITDAHGTGAKITGGQTAAFELRSHIFPIRGVHSYGGAGSRFGASRPGHIHQGQDVSAACGTRLLAAQGGKVVTRSYQAGGAGNYIVIKGNGTRKDYVYMHLRSPGLYGKGQVVRTGQQIGYVGSTGSSSGCHLHFERWTKPGWFTGGHPFDPLPTLRYWDSYS